MKKKINPQYKIATTAIHGTGDISRKEPDICVVSSEDEDNYYGNWVYGFGFIDVRFPKSTTRDLTPAEVDEYHGQPMMLNDSFLGVLNITGENFRKHVVITHTGNGKVHTGTLEAPIKVGRSIFISKDDGGFWNTSAVQSIQGNEVRTRNSLYMVEYV